MATKTGSSKPSKSSQLSSELAAGPLAQSSAGEDMEAMKRLRSLVTGQAGAASSSAGSTAAPSPSLDIVLGDWETVEPVAGKEPLILVVTLDEGSTFSCRGRTFKKSGWHAGARPDEDRSEWIRKDGSCIHMNGADWSLEFDKCVYGKQLQWRKSTGIELQMRRVFRQEALAKIESAQGEKPVARSSPSLVNVLDSDDEIETPCLPSAPAVSPATPSSKRAVRNALFQQEPRKRSRSHTVSDKWDEFSGDFRGELRAFSPDRQQAQLKARAKAEQLMRVKEEEKEKRASAPPSCPIPKPQAKAKGATAPANVAAKAPGVPPKVQTSATSDKLDTSSTAGNSDKAAKAEKAAVQTKKEEKPVLQVARSKSTATSSAAPYAAPKSKAPTQPNIAGDGSPSPFEVGRDQTPPKLVQPTSGASASPTETSGKTERRSRSPISFPEAYNTRPKAGAKAASNGARAKTSVEPKTASPEAPGVSAQLMPRSKTEPPEAPGFSAEAKSKSKVKAAEAPGISTKSQVRSRSRSPEPPGVSAKFKSRRPLSRDRRDILNGSRGRQSSRPSSSPVKEPPSEIDQGTVRLKEAKRESPSMPEDAFWQFWGSASHNGTEACAAGAVLRNSQIATENAKEAVKLAAQTAPGDTPTESPIVESIKSFAMCANVKCMFLRQDDESADESAYGGFCCFGCYNIHMRDSARTEGNDSLPLDHPEHCPRKLWRECDGLDIRRASPALDIRRVKKALRPRRQLCAAQISGCEMRSSSTSPVTT